MKLRVNLLKSSEQRYQGPVSLRFLVRTGSITVVSLVTLVVLLSVQKQFMLSHNLRAAKEEWASVGPRYAELMKKQTRLNNYKTILDELQTWGNTNAHWNEMLLGLQQVVPPSIQLTKLQVDSTWEFIKGPAPAVKPKHADTDEKKPAEEAAPDPEREVPLVPARSIRMVISGKVSGELADEVVVQFTKTVQKSRGFSVTFDSMELERLYRDATDSRGGQSSGSTRLFEISGVAKARKM